MHDQPAEPAENDPRRESQSDIASCAAPQIATLPLAIGSSAVLWLALPALGEQFLSYCVGLFDTYLAGKIPRVDDVPGVATSAVGLGAYLSWLSSLLFQLVGIGTTALIARTTGAGDVALVRRAVTVSVLLAIGLGLCISSAMYRLAPQIATTFGLDGAAGRIVVDFLQTDAFGQFFYGFCLVGVAAMRGAGDMRTPLVLLGIVNLFNMLASSCLVFGWLSLIPGLRELLGPWSEPLGTHGIVLGTVAARILGGVLTLMLLFRGSGALRIDLSEAKAAFQEAPRILAVGGPAAMDGVVMWFGQMTFLKIVSALQNGGPDANRAAHLIAIEVEGLSYLSAVAWGYASASLIGRALGSGRPEEALRAGVIASRQVAVIGAAAMLVYIFAARPIFENMTIDPAVQAVGIPAMRTLAFYQIPLVMMIVYTFSLRGAGETRVPLIINLVGVFGVRLTVGYWFGIVCNGGLIGAWIGMFCDVTVRWLLTGWYFRRGKWTTVRV